jgi:hypothetical protein
MNSLTAKNRLQWILLSVLLFGGIFVGSVIGRSCKGSHVPVRTASRAIGARTSLSSAVHEQHLLEPALAGSELFRMLVDLPMVRPMGVHQPDLRIQSSFGTGLWSPPLLRRPPPVSIFA